MKKAKHILRITATLSAILLLLCCNPLEDESKSSSILVVLRVTGTDIEQNEVNYLQSDVALGNGSVQADAAKATLTAKLLDPEPLLYDEASHYSSIMITRYIVSYSRTDGRNVEGVDIPYSFEGSLSALVEVDSSVDISFIVVREVAKLEPPLIDLVESGLEGGDEIVLQVTAKIEFYGHDLTNNAVKATGYLPIFFANYADEEGEE